MPLPEKRPPSPARHHKDTTMSFAGRINVYRCPHGQDTVTIDAVEGTTPFMIRCRCGCDEMAQSQMYRVDQTLRPNYEWYSPDQAERKKLDPATREHVRMGGLLMRRLDPIRRDSLANKYGLTHLRV